VNLMGEGLQAGIYRDQESPADTAYGVTVEYILALIVRLPTRVEWTTTLSQTMYVHARHSPCCS